MSKLILGAIGPVVLFLIVVGCIIAGAIVGGLGRAWGLW